MLNLFLKKQNLLKELYNIIKNTDDEIIQNLFKLVAPEVVKGNFDVALEKNKVTINIIK